MSERYKDNTKRPKPQYTQLGGNLGNDAFCGKIQQKASGPGEGAGGIM